MISDAPQIKLRRAHEHLGQLAERLASFVSSHPMTVAVAPNPRPPNYIVTAEGYREPDRALGTIIGDIAHNARSALDVVIQQISDLPSSDARRFDLQFPVFDHQTGRRSYRANEGRYLAGVGADVRSIIESFQPYQCGAQFADDPLGILASISNADKHRLLHVVSSVGQVGLKFYGPLNLGAINVHEGADVTLVNTTIRGWPNFGIEWVNNGIITKNHGLVASITSQQPVNLEPKVTPGFQFGDGSGRAEGRPVMDTLSSILARVDEVLAGL